MHESAELLGGVRRFCLVRFWLGFCMVSLTGLASFRRYEEFLWFQNSGVPYLLLLVVF